MNPRIVTLGRIVSKVATALIITVVAFWVIVGVAALAAHILGIPRR